MAYRQRSHRLGLTTCIVCLLAACFPALVAQDLRYLHHQAWSTEEGLPQDSVHRILQTPDGFLWVATEGGVARFDGVSFATFHRANEPAFTSDDTCCLAAEPNGDLWIGTADGLLRFRDNRFSRFGTSEGLPSNTIKAIQAGTGGRVVIQTADGTAVWDGHGFERTSGADDRAVLAPSVEGASGTGWAFSATTVTFNANRQTREWRVGSTLPGSRVETVFVDRHGTAWVGTNDGLVALRRDFAGTIAIPAMRGISILQVFEDREGNVWVGTETSGLHLLRTLPFRTEPALADKPLTALVQSTDGSVWLGTRRDGLRRVRNGVVDEPAKAASLTSPVILSLAPGPQGSVWAGTPDGLNHVLPNGKVRRLTSADGLPDDYIQALQSARDGSLWAGTRHGLVHLEGGKMQVFTKADRLGGDLIGALLVSLRGGLWIATNGGLSHRDPTGKITTFTAKDGVPEGVVSAMAEDPTGALWIATQPGTLTRFAGGSFHPIASFSAITGLAADAQGQLWLRQERGISRLSIEALDHCADRAQPCSLAPVHYGTASGLPSEETDPGGSPALWAMASGELWFATRRGVAIVDTSHPLVAPAPPPTVIERFLVDDAPVAGIPVLDLPYARARYTFEYAGLSYTAPTEVRYRVKLEGFDSDWIDAATHRSATYTNLPPGRFRFRVQSRVANGLWNEAGAAFAFRIVPPFYRRWWFYLLAALSVAALIGALYRLRLRRLEGRFNAVLQERNRMAREIHDTLAQDFVGVSLQLDLIAQFLSLSKVDAALNQVRQTRKLVTDGLAEARRSIWELRANLAQDSLPSRLAQVVERYSGDAPQVHLKIGGAYRTLDPRVEAEFLRVAQEALSNVQRHAGATEAVVELRYKSDMLVLTVEDNGHGFAVEQAPANGHYGLRGMQERAAAIAGKLELVSKPGAGTTITLSAAIPGAEEKA